MSDDFAENDIFSTPEKEKKAPDGLVKSGMSVTGKASLPTLNVTSGSTNSPGSGEYYNVTASGTSVDWLFGGTHASLIFSTNSSVVFQGATALDGAAIAAAFGGHLYNGYAGSNASIDAVQGGVVSGVEIASGGAAAASLVTDDGDGTKPSVTWGVCGATSVPYGGTILDPLVHSGGYILAGGGAPGFTVKGYKLAGSGGLVSGGNFEDGSEMAVGKGGTSLDGLFAGKQIVQSTGLTIGDVFKGSGATQLINGGLASRSTAESGGLVSVSGGHGSGLIAGQGGTIQVTGGTYQSILTSDGQVAFGGYTSGYSDGDVIQNGGTEVIGSDGVATSSVVSSGGREIVSDGGSALLTNVSGGTAEVLTGGYMSGGSASQGGEIAISAGGTGVSIAADAGGYVDLHSAAIAENIIANDSGHVLVEGGGVVSGAVANSGGLFDLQNGATVTDGFQVNGGTAEISGQVDSLTIHGGAAVVHAGGEIATNGVVSGSTDIAAGAFLKGTLQFDSGAIIMSDRPISAGIGGIAIIENGAQAFDVIADGGGLVNGPSGTAIINGHATAVIAENGGVVSAGGGADIDRLSYVQGGSVFVGNGAVLNTEPVAVIGADPGHVAYMEIETGGYVDSASVSNYGTVNVNHGSATDVTIGINGEISLGNAGKACIVNVTDGGRVHINDGGTIDTLSASNGGVMDVKAGGSVGGVFAVSGATAVISSGAYASNVEVINNGQGTILAGATVNRLTVAAGGSVAFLSGGSALSITVASGGSVSGPVVTDGHTLNVSADGTVSGATITTGIHDARPYPAGGTDHSTIVDNTGGEAYAGAGADLESTTITGAVSAGGVGGLLVVDSGATLQNTSMGSNARIRVNGLDYNDQDQYVDLLGNQLVVHEGAETWSMTLDGSYNPKDFMLLDDGHGNTVVVYACFLAGAMIRLENGDVPVEEVKEGDLLCVLEGDQQSVREVKSVIQKHAVVRKDLPEDMAGWPVHVCKDAFASGVPSQDLFVTPEHCFYLNGRFVPVRMLVNGTTIRYDHSQDRYDYYHVQTEPHAIIWVNNTLTESYLETGTRQVLAGQSGNVAQIVRLKELSWVNDAAAPLDVSREFVEPLYNRFRDRALSLNGASEADISERRALTEESDLKLVLDDGTIIERIHERAGKIVFALPRRTKNVRLRSRCFRPSSAIGPFVDDRRELGVLVGNVEFWVGGREINVTSYLEQKELPGWSVVEAGPHRWTTGNALLPLPECAIAEGEKVLLVLQIEAGGPYPQEVASLPESNIALRA